MLNNNLKKRKENVFFLLLIPFQTEKEMVKMLIRSPYVNKPLPSVLGRTFMLVLSPVIATFVSFLWINNNNTFSTFLTFYNSEINFESFQTYFEKS